MSSCGCGPRQCACTVTAGPGVTVEGNGSAGAPYVISAGPSTTVVQAADSPSVDVTVSGTGTMADPYLVGAAVVVDPAPPGGGSNLLHSGPAGLFVECADVRTCFTATGGVAYDPATGEFTADLSADAGNTIVLGGDGGLFVPGAAATVVQAADSPSVDVTVSGTGTAGNPYLVGAAVVPDPAPPGGGANLLHVGPDGVYVECADVRGCISAEGGAAYDPATGIITADLSADAGNTIVLGGDGGLYAAGGTPTVVQAADSPSVDVTVSGIGTAGDPYLVGAAVVPDPAPPGGGTNLLHVGPDGVYVECADVRGCISAEGGAAYDPATGIITADLSSQAGNAIVLGPDGGLYAPTGGGGGGTIVQAADSPSVDVTVSGTGTAGDPYLVGAAVVPDPAPPGGGTNLLHVGADGVYVECADVRGCISAEGGAAYDPATGIITADLSADAGNTLVLGGDGGLYVPAGGGGGGTIVQAADTPTVDVTVSGTGTAGDPYQVSAAVIPDPAPPGGGTNLLHAGPDGVYVECADVRGCISADGGAAYDPATGIITADLSADAGNQLVLGTDGGLLVPPAAEPTVDTACGLTGDGSTAAPLAVATAAWPYPCDVDALGGVISCGTDGVLRGEPRTQVSFFNFTESRNYADLTVPAGFDNVVDTFSTTFTNPDTCRPAMLVVERELDVDFNLPAGAGAAYGQDTDEVYYTRNTGTSTINDAHVQTTKLFLHTTNVPPGGSATVNFPVTLGRGSAGATYNRIQVFLRGLMISH
ncbi:hypothetical protein ABZ312_09410 [Streptomyces sp. NPDC006207]